MNIDRALVENLWPAIIELRDKRADLLAQASALLAQELRYRDIAAGAGIAEPTTIPLYTEEIR